MATFIPSYYTQFTPYDKINEKTDNEIVLSNSNQVFARILQCKLN